MLSFNVTKPKQTLEKQWAFLVQRGQDNKLKTIKVALVMLLLVTALYLLFYFVTAVNDFIVFKGVAMFLIALAWLTSAVLLPLNIWLSKRKNKQRLRQFLGFFKDTELNYSVQIDEEKVVIVSSNETQEFLWTDFTAFGIHHETLYVLNTVRGINSLYWDESEIGSEAYSGLLEIVKKKAIKQAF